jgi:hypothetical protein
MPDVVDGFGRWDGQLLGRVLFFFREFERLRFLAITLLSASCTGSGGCCKLHGAEIGQPRQLCFAPKYFTFVLLRGDGLDQTLKRWLQVGLVVDQQGVLGEEGGVEGSGLEAGAIAAEEQAAADHVHGADDDGGLGGVGGPFLIVGKLAAQGADGELVLADVVLKFLGFGGGLVHHGAAVDDIDQAPWQRRLLLARQPPDGEHGRFTQAGGDAAGPRKGKVVLNKPVVESLLPREWPVVGDVFECLCE